MTASHRCGQPGPSLASGSLPVAAAVNPSMGATLQPQQPAPLSGSKSAPGFSAPPALAGSMPTPSFPSPAMCSVPVSARGYPAQPGYPYPAQPGYPYPAQPGYPQAGPQRPQVIPIPDRQPWNAYGMTQEEYDQMYTIFLTFDEDGSGELDREEVARLCRYLNYAHSDAEVRRIFTTMDMDNSGSLTMAELLTWMKYNKPNPEALYGLTYMEYHQIMFQFNSFDTNMDGQLSQAEFVQLIRQMGLGDGAAIFKQVDTNKSGKVDLHEFLAFRKAAGRR